MLDWIKEHKRYVGITLVLVFLLGYYFVFALPEASEEANWNVSEEHDLEMIEETPLEQLPEEEILIDVKGAVQKPGVYKAVLGERVIDIIEKAGGITERANSAAINFAMRVTDEMIVYVPSIGEEENNRDVVMAASSSGNSDQININQATQAELETLPGIGPSKAQAIIEYRETNGPFKAIEDIMSISGFGEKTFEKLKDSIRVN